MCVCVCPGGEGKGSKELPLFPKAGGLEQGAGAVKSSHLHREHGLNCARRVGTVY